MILPFVNREDWDAVNRNFQKLRFQMGPSSLPIFAGLTLTGLTATRLMQTNASKGLASVSDLSSWIGGTTNRITVTSDGDGTVTLSGPQDIHTGADPTFAGLNLTGSADFTTNAITFQPTVDSATFFRIMDADGGTPIITVDSVNEWMGLGTDTPLRKFHLYDPYGSCEFLMERGDQAVDKKRFNIFIASGTTYFRVLNDAGNGGLNWLSANHTTGLLTAVDLSLTSPSSIYGLNHDSFTGFVVNEHIDHSMVSILAGTGMSGGGDISASRTLNCTITQYTDALARAAISETVTGLDYNNTTGVFNLTSGYVIPTTTQETNWGTAYTHSQVAGGDSVHVSVTENSNWDAAYTHITSTGDDHTWLNQDVTIPASPTFAGLELKESLVTTDTYTKLLLHFDGLDASASIKDNSFSQHAPTIVGDAQIDTAQSKFGGSSCLFDGTGDYVTIPDHADWDFGSGDFTIDFWIRPTDTNRHAIFAGTSDYWFGIDYHFLGTRNINIWASSNGTSWNLLNADSGGNAIGTITLVLDTWTHVAIIRNGNNWRSYINGVKDIDVTVAGTLVTQASAKNIGRWGGDAIPKWLGWIDEFRISKGIARWTAAFTSPTRPYGDGTFSRIGIGYPTVKNGGLAVKEWLGVGTDTPLRKFHVYDPYGDAEILLERGDQGVDQKRFNIFIANNKTNFRTLNDAASGGLVWLYATHSTGEVTLNYPLICEESLFITEKAADLADRAGKGQIWVKNTTPNELWFTDNAGTARKIESFVDRGDPAGADYTQATLTADGTWRDLNLSAIVPAGAHRVRLYGQIKDGVAGRYIAFRKNGHVNNFNLLVVQENVANLDEYFQGEVECDTNRIIEYQISNAVIAAITVVVIGWWI